MTSREDVDLAIGAGADALGFLVGLRYRANDQLTIEAAAGLVASMPPFVASVLVTHSVDVAWIVGAARQMRCTTLQLHGPIALPDLGEVASQLPHCKIIKTVHVENADSLEHAIAADRIADGILLDTKTATRLGGTGKTHDWSLSRRIVDTVHKPVILAGGLSPENVERAIEAVRPFAVDVNSGVERPDGAKDPGRVRAFVDKAQAAGARLAQD